MIFLCHKNGSSNIEIAICMDSVCFHSAMTMNVYVNQDERVVETDIS